MSVLSRILKFSGTKSTGVNYAIAVEGGILFCITLEEVVWDDDCCSNGDNNAPCCQFAKEGPAEARSI